MDKRQVLIALSICLFIYLLGIRIPVLDIDSAQYASMSREMKESGQYLQVHDLGNDYLDKPPFLFWITAVSMKIFGENNFGFRLPSILFALLAIFATFRLALIYYNRRTALLAAIVLAGCQAMFTITHDVRTDTILMSFVVLSCWQLAAWLKNKRLINLVIAFACIGGGMMTKGPIALMVPVFAFGTDLLLKRDFKAIFKWQYLAGLVIIALVLLPMSIGLYQQFDLHPEKVVNSKTGISGLRFFYWTQSFGRITGESEWNNHAGFFFLLQNMLWAFLPWILFFLTAMYLKTVVLFQDRFKINKQQEYLTYGGFVITYCSLAISHYQLPHYIFVVFPFAAIITASFLSDLVWGKRQRWRQAFTYVHLVIFLLLLLVADWLIIQCFKEISALWKIFIAAGTIGYIFLIVKEKLKPNLIFISAYTIIVINIALTGAFYPALLRYQGASEVGKWVSMHNIPRDKFVLYQYPKFARSLHFYAKRVVPVAQDPTQLKHNTYVLTALAGKQSIDSMNLPYEISLQGGDYDVSMLSMPFLNPATRSSELTPYYLLKIK